jgi:hypothetical protein
VNLAIFSNLAQHTWHRSRQVVATALVALATVLTSADPMRHVLQDSGIWPARASHMYRLPAGTCSSADDETCTHDFGRVWRCDADVLQCVCTQASWRCLSVLGALFSAATWLGFVFLFAGVLRGTGLVGKLYRAFATQRTTN